MTRRVPRPLAAVAALLGVGSLLLAGCAGTTAPSEQAGPSAAPDPNTCSYPPGGDPAKPVAPPSTAEVNSSGPVSWTLTTNQGDITLTGDPGRAPCTVNSFNSLVKQQYFDNTKCHRLVDSGIFVLQCGDPTGTGQGGPGYTFADEKSADNSYKQGAVAMANSGPDTNGSQFFLVYQDSELPPDYTVFARLDQASIDVVGKIAAAGQDGSSAGGGGAPNSETSIISAVAKP